MFFAFNYSRENNVSFYSHEVINFIELHLYNLGDMLKNYSVLLWYV